MGNRYQVFFFQVSFEISSPSLRGKEIFECHLMRSTAAGAMINRLFWTTTREWYISKSIASVAANNIHSSQNLILQSISHRSISHPRATIMAMARLVVAPFLVPVFVPADGTEVLRLRCDVQIGLHVGATDDVRVLKDMCGCEEREC